MVHVGTFAVRCGGNDDNVDDLGAVFNQNAVPASSDKHPVYQYTSLSELNLLFCVRILVNIDKIHTESFSIEGQLCDSQGLNIYTLLSVFRHSSVIFLDTSFTLQHPILTLSDPFVIHRP